jgi:hypothetical protein
VLAIGDEHDCRIIYGCGSTTIHSNNVESNIVVIIAIHPTCDGFEIGLGTTRFGSKTISIGQGAWAHQEDHHQDKNDKAPTTNNCS